MLGNLKLSLPKDKSSATDRLQIIVEGLEPGEKIELSVSTTDNSGFIWSSKGIFAANSEGKVNSLESPSSGGSYIGADEGGMFWSLSPSSGTDRKFQIEASNRSNMLGQPDFLPYEDIVYNVVARRAQGESVEGNFSVSRLNKNIEVINVTSGRLRGTLLRWRDRSESRGAVMSLTGSGGGIETGHAPLLASLGFDVLSLAYFNFDDLPQTLVSIPLEYFSEGFDFIEQQCGFKEVHVIGASKGGELGLVLASTFPERVSKVIPIVPMHVSSEGWDLSGAGGAKPSWTLDGEPYPFALLTGLPSVEEMREKGRKSPSGYAATPDYMPLLSCESAMEKVIPVEEAKCPILLISAEDDQMWPSRWGADRVVDRLRQYHYPFNYQHIVLDNTGHWAPLPNTPTIFSDAVYHSGALIFMDCGGSAPSTGRASWVMWDAIESFLLDDV